MFQLPAPGFLEAGSWTLEAVYLYGSILASLRASASWTVVKPRSLRFRFLDLLLRMCCLNALLRRNFPLFVRLKRFAAPRCVFSFSFFAIATLRSMRLLSG